MSGFDVIDLEVGGGRLLRGAPWAVAALGFVMLVSSDAAAALKTILLVCLVLGSGACVLRPPRTHAISRLRLFADGGAVLYTATGVLTATISDEGWATRWCCIVPFVDTLSGRRVLCLLCRSRNLPDSYRRLLVHLRLAGAGQGLRGVAT